jgi:hypothetical protein
MIFSDLYKSPRSPLSKFRYSTIQPNPLPDFDPDLLSKDKTKQKEAVKRYLAEKVRNDWEFTWPPPPKALSNTKSLATHGDPPLTSSTATSATVAATDVTLGPGAVTLFSPHTVPVVAGTILTEEEPPEVAANTPITSPPNHELAAEELPETSLQADEDNVDSDDNDDDDDDDDDDTASNYSTHSEDLVHYRYRAEWASELSDDESPTPSSPFRFDNPDAVGDTVKATLIARKARRRRANREECQWNEGLACFEARRNAWTEAKTVRVRMKPVSPTTSFSSLSPRRLFFRSSMATSPPANPASAKLTQHTNTALSQQWATAEGPNARSDTSQHSKDATTKEMGKHMSKHSTQSTSSSQIYPVETILPVPPPLLPPANPMRASINPSLYLSLYDKVVVHSLTPSCPVNLSDMLPACVAGWKRDGEWPPRPSAIDPTSAAVARRKKKAAAEAAASGGMARRMSFNFLGKGSEKEHKDEEGTNGAGKGIRRSLQRVLGLGSNGNGIGKVADHPLPG